MNSNLIINISAFAILTGLWLAFAYGLLFNREMLASAWRSFRSWPLLVKALVVLLTLPVVLSLWVWNTKWPAWLRLVLVLGLAWFTEYTFFPATITF